MRGGARTFIVPGKAGTGGTGGGSDGFNRISAGTQIAGTLATVLFADSNGVSFGMSGNSQVTATVKTDYLTTAMRSDAATISNINVSAGTLSQNRSDITFSNSNGVSFGLNTDGVVTGSIATSLTNVGVSAGTTSNLLSAITFSNSNGVSFGLNASTLTASHNALTSQSTQYLAITLGGNTAGTTTFHASNNASIFLNGGNNITLSGNGSTITISGAAAAGGDAIRALSDPVGVVSLTASSIGFGQFGAMSIVFDTNVNSVSFSGLRFSAGMSTGGNTVGTTGFANNDAREGRLVLAGGNNITLSGSTSSGSMTITISGAAGGGGGTLSGFFPIGYDNTITTTIGQSTLHLFPIHVWGNLSISRANAFVSISLSSSSNSSHAGRISLDVGIYTRNASTLSLASSGSVAHSWTNTSNGSTSVLSGIRMVSVPVNANLTPGDYWIGFLSRTGTVNANWFTASNLLGTYLNIVYSGPLGAAGTASHQLFPGWGMFSAQTAAMPGSIAFSAISGTAISVIRVPVMNFVNYTG